MSTPYPVQPTDQAMTELRRGVLASDVAIPVMSIASLAPSGRVRLHGEGIEELVTYTGCGVDVVGMPTLTGCTRGADQAQGGSVARDWPGGTYLTQSPYDRVELVMAIPEATADQSGRAVYLDAVDPELTFFGQAGAESAMAHDLSTPIFYPAVWLAHVGAPGAGTGQFDGDIRGIVPVSLSYAFYVTADDRVQSFATPAGSYVPSVIAGPGAGNGQVNTPWGIAFDNLGRLVIGDSGNARLQWLSTAGAYAAQVTTIAGVPIDEPRGVAQEPGTIYTWFADHGEGAVRGCSSAGAIRTMEDLYPGAQDVAFNPLGDYSVLAGSNQTIFSLQWATGTSGVTSFGGAGVASGMFAGAQAVAIDHEARIFVADTDNHRVQVFDMGGRYLGQIGTYGAGEGELIRPTALAISNLGSEVLLFVGESGNGRISQFSLPVTSSPLIVGTYSGTWAPAALGGDAGQATSVSIPGAVVGDYVEVSHTGARSNSYLVWLEAFVSGANAVTVHAYNRHPTVAQTLGSGTLKVRVTR